jgi:serine/threonine protein kinase
MLMASFFRRLFGGGKRPAGGEAARGRSTIQASRVVESEARVETIRSDQFKSVAGRKGAPEEKDTAPWFIGKTVGEIYQIRGVLGRGGMGIVYRGYDTATQRDIAIKVPLGKFVDDDGGRKRFAREAEIWSGLVHPHIVHTFDVRDDQTTDYRPAVFMDYCDGGSLADRLRNGPPLSMADALDIAIQICWAMEFAHEKGHIHRDLKPGNVLLTKDGKALVSDFGLVKSLDLEDLEVMESQLKQQDEAVQTSLTRGLAMGTPEYMPPEQWAGNSCKQSDIYAFGIMLYELFCGSRPFSAENRADLWIPHYKVPPPDPRRLNGQLPAVLAELMSACLAKKPAERPQSFGAVAKRLSESYQQIAGKPYTVRCDKPTTTKVSREHKVAQSWALLRLGTGCQLRGDLGEADRQFAKALAMFEDLADAPGVAACKTQMGSIQRERGHYEDALRLHQTSLAIYERLKDQSGLAQCYYDLGLVLWMRTDIDGALQWFHRSLVIAQEVGDCPRIARCLHTIGETLQSPGRIREAEAALQQARDLYQELGDRFGLGAIDYDSGLLLEDRGKWKKALAKYRSAIATMEQIGARHQLLRIHISVGSILSNRKNWNDASVEYEKALRLAQEVGDPVGVAAVHHNIGSLLTAQKRFPEALAKFHKGLAVMEKLGRRGEIAMALLNIALVCERCGDYAQALQLYHRHAALKAELGEEVAGWLPAKIRELNERGFDLDKPSS